MESIFDFAVIAVFIDGRSPLGVWIFADTVIFFLKIDL